MIKNNTLQFTQSKRKLFPLFSSPLVLMFAVLILANACNDDDEKDYSADIARIVGTYTVTDTDEDDEVETYTVVITKSGNGIEITNFGDIMYVPVKATISGNTLTIPSQTFKGNTMTIKIYGQGTLNNNNLTFDYTIETDGDYFLEHTCTAERSI